MFGKTRQPAGSPAKAEVGEIDTSAPFQSVKAAVSLFAEGAFSAEKVAVKKSKTPDDEKRVEKETQLLLAQRELKKYKERLRSAESTKDQALVELEKARGIANTLTYKLSSLNESKESALLATQTANDQAKELEGANSNNQISNDISWQTELADARGRYSSVVAELDEAKQELRRMRQEFSASTDVKSSATVRATEAVHAIEANTGRADELRKEIAAVNSSLTHVKHAYVQTMQEHAGIMKSLEDSSSTTAAQQTQVALEALQMEAHAEDTGDLEAKLAATVAEVRSVEQQLNSVKASQLSSLASVTTDLTEAKGTLHKLAEEEQTQRNLLESLKMELAKVKREHQELKKKEAEAEIISGELQCKLQNAKDELAVALAAEAKVRGASDELISTLNQLTAECEDAKVEADKMKQEAEMLKREAETTKIVLEDSEKRLSVALVEAEEAKAAEASALSQIKSLSEKTDAARASTSEHGAKITISMEEFVSLNKKVNDADTLAGMKVSAAAALVEAVKASETEAMKKLESIRKEIEGIQVATAEAIKKAEMADAAKRAVEGELKRWREREQKKWGSAEINLRVPVDQKEYVANRLSDVGPATVEMKACWADKSANDSRKIVRSSTMKKKMFPSLSGIFNRKKNQVEAGMASYLPGENVS
ncbi:WEB family protein [Nymphaea thermarum]|nr:WEB family protein [Nymphaea thermarum]